MDRLRQRKFSRFQKDAKNKVLEYLESIARLLAWSLKRAEFVISVSHEKRFLYSLSLKISLKLLPSTADRENRRLLSADFRLQTPKYYLC